MHQGNLQVLITEIFKIKNGCTPPIRHSLHQFQENTFNLRNFREIVTEKKNFVNYGIETVIYKAAFLCPNLQTACKTTKSLNKFKTKIKLWRARAHPSRLCKSCHLNLGYI